MIKFFSRVFAFSALAFVSSTLFAQSGNIGVVDIGKAMLSTDYAKALVEQKNSDPEVEKLTSTFQSLRADLQAMLSEAEANASTWSAEQQEEYNKQIQYKSADYQLAGQKLDQEQKDIVDRIQLDLGERVYLALSELAESEGLSLVLHKDVAIIVSPTVDLTDKLVAKLNEPVSQ